MHIGSGFGFDTTFPHDISPHFHTWHQWGAGVRCYGCTAYRQSLADLVYVDASDTWEDRETARQLAEAAAVRLLRGSHRKVGAYGSRL